MRKSGVNLAARWGGWHVNATTERRTVGSTALRLPTFGLGTAHLGELYAKVDEADSRATLDAAWDAGVRYYDTAPWYGRGLSEHRLGGFPPPHPPHTPPTT